ncbi:uncharacterized protein LOC110984363 isoform X2 [Acanthaster planci]|uniref:Uncharacterized protein LOC110984363 isoform X2 n=1 Tax=Acanthaster planci TaxID=133434 RepID=A0A8B7ZAB4_ACAPL|nr:uncharacterized protein LOC110984363 isoform X2 [Acanthaster planci]
MDVVPKKLNKQTLTPWTDGDPLPHQAGSNGDSCGEGREFAGGSDQGGPTEGHPALLADKAQNTAFDEEGFSGDSTQPEISASSDVTCWTLTDGASDDWPGMSNGSRDDAPEGTVPASPWGDDPGTHHSVLDTREASEQDPPSPTRPHRSQGLQPTANPFGRDPDAFGAGFMDNFCEMSETDLIFRSGLVDEEFKTVSVTAEEDDLWSSFAQPDKSIAQANQETEPGSWDPFPANHDSPNTGPVPVQCQPDPSGDPSNGTGQVTSEHINEDTRTVDFPTEQQQLPDTPQLDTNQHSDVTAFPLEVKTDTSSEKNQHLANEIVQCDNEAESPSIEVTASGDRIQVNSNIKQLLKDTAFKEIMLDESWMAEKDCLESKAFTVDLCHKGASPDPEEAATSMDLLSDQTIPDDKGQLDSLNNLPIPAKTASDLNANMETNGAAQDLLINFGDSAGDIDAKLVVAPPPEFDTNFDPLLANVESKPTCNSEHSNGDLLMMSMEIPSDSADLRNPDQKTTGNLDRTASDLERFLNELGEGTAVDEDQDTNVGRTPSDMERLLNQLGDGTAIDEIEESSQELASGDMNGTVDGSGDGTGIEDNNENTNRPRTPSEVDRFLNELGDGTIIDDEDKGADKEQIPSDVDRLLNELGDGTVIDEVGDPIKTSGVDEGDELNPSEQEGDVQKMEEVVAEAPSQEEKSARNTNEAWDQLVREGSITMQENVPEQSSSMSGIPSSPLDSGEEVDKPVPVSANTEEEVVKTNVVDAEAEPVISHPGIRLDRDAKRRSFFGEGDSIAKDSAFQPKMPEQPSPSSPVSSISISSALPSVPVLPKVNTAYQRPKNFYETKPRAATDSFVSSHALLGLGGEQTISADTKSRSASEPPPSTSTTEVDPPAEAITFPRSEDTCFAAEPPLEGVMSSRSEDPGIAAEPPPEAITSSWSVSPGIAAEPPLEAITSPSSKDPGIAAEPPEVITSPSSKDSIVTTKSTQFIRALYGSKPGSKPSDLVDEDGKTLLEYEQERREVLAAVKVKRKKKVSWQGGSSQFENLTSPDSEGPLSPTGKSSIVKQEPSPLSPVFLGHTSQGSAINFTTLTPKPYKPLGHRVEIPSNKPKEDTFVPDVTNSTLQLLPEKPPDTDSKSPQSAASVNVALVGSPASTKSDDKMSSVECAPKELDTPCLSKTPSQELQAKIFEASSEPPGTSKVQPAESKQEGNDEAPIDLKKMRSLWEQKSTMASAMEAESLHLKKSHPRRMFSFEVKLKEAAREKTAPKQAAPEAEVRADIPLEDDSSDIMPKDLDDDYDRCDSYTYEVMPQRKTAILSHRTSESIIAKEIREQKEREQELLKEGRLKSTTDQDEVDKDMQVHLIKQESIDDKEVRLNKKQNTGCIAELQKAQKVQENGGSSIEGLCCEPEQSSLPITIRYAEQNSKGPQLMAEPEVTQQTIQVQETLPRGQTRSASPEPAVVIIDKDKAEASETQEVPRRKESIVQREIRLQREREGENVLERQRALEETRTRRASLEGSSHSSSGRSTPIKGLQSPTTSSSTFTPIKIALAPAGPKSAPIKPALTPVSPKRVDSPLMTAKPPEKPPLVRFGLSSVDLEPYSSYREYQKMLRGRKTGEKSSDKPGPMKATEGSVSVKQSPVGAAVKEITAKEQGQQRPPSPIVVRPPSPLLRRPPSPAPHRVPSPVEEPSSQDTTDSAPSKPETLVQREIRLAKEREAELQKERASANPSTDLKKAFDADISEVVLVEKTPTLERSKVTEMAPVTPRPQVTQSPRSVSSPEQEVVVMRRGGETPMERDIRLAEERETMLRKEREETLSPVKRSPYSQAESLIQQEIRLQQEREDQYRREKGLMSPTSPRLTGDMTDSTMQGGAEGGEMEETSPSSSEKPTPKYRPQRRSLIMAQQWEEKFK